MGSSPTEPIIMRVYHSDSRRNEVEERRDMLKSKGYKTRITTNKYKVHILRTENKEELFNDK